MMRPPSPPPAPREPDPVRIPSPDDPDLLAARRRKMRDEFDNRRGRDSTALGGGTESGAYNRTTLG